MLTKLKPRSEFSRNVLTLMTGTTIAQAIPIAISPILTRIYTPEDFGVFALFFAIAAIFGSIANGRYELAIMLPKKDEDAINIFALGFIIVSFLSLSLLVLVLLFNDYFTNLLGNEDISIWLYFVPIAVFFTGLWNILNYFNNRRKNYKDLRNATILKSIVLAVVQLSVGFVKSGATGLISGSLLSNMFANMKLFKNITKDKLLLSKISKIKIIALAKRYKDFPQYSMPTVLVNNLSQHLVNIFIPIIYNLSTLGFYSLVQRVLLLPSSLIGNSIGQVFFNYANTEKNKTGSAQKIFHLTLLKLILIATPLYVLIYIFIEDVFGLIFGKNWIVAGEYSKILILMFYIRFIVSSVANMNVIYNKNKTFLLWQIGLLLINISLIFISKYLQLDFKVYLYLVNMFISSYYLYLLFIMNKYDRA